LVNTLGYTNVDQVIPFPRSVAQVVTMGALVAAFGLALVLNPRIRVRPSAYLLLLSLLAVISLVSSIYLQSGMGAIFRCFRLTLFVVTLWLLSAWWRGTLSFVRYHLLAVCAVLLTVLLGLVVSPGGAFSGPGGRLVGAIWPIPAPQVGLYCAVATGLAVLLWLARELDGRSAMVIVVPAVTLLLLSHTRTALLGLVVGMVLAGFSQAFSDARVRRALATIVAVGAVVVWVFGQGVMTWLRRGQDSDELTTLTGRAKVWDRLLGEQRTIGEQLLGVGLTNKSFDGLAIDNSWLSVYHEQGFVGVALVAVFLAALLAAAALRPPSPQRMCAVFLIVYGLVASYTEVGLGDASPYLLNLAVAASLLLRPHASGIRESRPLAVSP
jgi:O-antigen ligase